MNFAEADYVMTHAGNVAGYGRYDAEIGVRVEIEAFDTGHLWLAKQLVSEADNRPVLRSSVWGCPGAHRMI